jgi:murein DD-endopeptidase MepM/ murein hydrolase activator NlpD
VFDGPDFDETMTTIIPIEDLHAAMHLEAREGWGYGRGYQDYRPTRSEVTQDILLPEAEFIEDEPLDVSGARLDTYGLANSGEIRLPRTDTADKPFRTNTGQGRRSRGRHRVAAPPTALKGGRAALFAVAAGAAVAAVSQINSSSEAPAPAPAANVTDPAVAATSAPDLGPGVAAAAPSADLSVFTDQLQLGQARAAEEARREALARRPMFESPLPLGSYQLTSAYANRWGSFHGGIDMAAPLGTPIHAATDGVIKEAGPASGYGNWVQLEAADGTITMYGHMSSSGVLVHAGQRVTAGDVIALVGSEGFSTGPHVHFEVWKNGNTKIDPAPWLARHGVRLAGYSG